MPELGRAEGRKTVIRIECMKELFSIKEKNEFKFRSSYVVSGSCIGQVWSLAGVSGKRLCVECTELRARSV